MTRTVLVALALALPISDGPAALAVDATCQSHAATHTLVRNDVLAKMDAAEQNLEKAEAALVVAEADLKKAAAAMETLQAQRTALLDHVEALNKVISAQCAAPARIEDAVADAWEWADAPLAFAAGAGTCVGVAWGLRQAQR